MNRKTPYDWNHCWRSHPTGRISILILAVTSTWPFIISLGAITVLVYRGWELFTVFRYYSENFVQLTRKILCLFINFPLLGCAFSALCFNRPFTHGHYSYAYVFELLKLHRRYRFNSRFLLQIYLGSKFCPSFVEMTFDFLLDISENFLCSMYFLLVIIALPLDELDVYRDADVFGTKTVSHKHILLYFLIIKVLICFQYISSHCIMVGMTVLVEWLLCKWYEFYCFVFLCVCVYVCYLFSPAWSIIGFVLLNKQVNKRRIYFIWIVSGVLNSGNIL
jgi:hypothetical protein